MAQQIKRLSARKVETLTKPGKYASGGGLYLAISKGGAKRWMLLFRQDDRMREMGLGGTKAVSLAKAREKAQKAREQIADGLDPIVEREQVRTIPTFGEMADDVIEALRPEWRNAKYAAQWEMTLKEYAKPLRGLPVDKVTTDHVLRVLKPIWQIKAETANRVRSRIERVLDAAKARGLRSGENPAAWRGHLQLLLPKQPKLTRGHHAALPYAEVPGFLVTLRETQAVSGMALEFAILTAARSGEVLGVRWSEIDLASRV